MKSTTIRKRECARISNYHAHLSNNRSTKKHPSNTLVLSITIVLLMIVHGVSGQDIAGNEACRCLSADELNVVDSTLRADFATEIGSHKDASTYGIGCQSHDQDALTCLDASDCTSIVPLPPDCDKSYCTRSWCYVDESCPLLSSPSSLFKGRYFSYAACGELDRFTYTDRLRSLRGQTFKVGFTSNSGGWKGGFNPSGSFAINEMWHGPIVEFVRESALIGGFTINMTAPPAWIKPMSQEFFGTSSFDYCVFATALGYLDFCVGGFTITEKRSSVTTIFEAASDPFYLIVFTENEAGSSWETFVQSTLTIFQPFTAAAWAMIFLFALPILSFLMLFHEYGAPGSSYPVSEPILIEQPDGRAEVVVRPISFFKHGLNSFYTGTLSFFQGSYDLSVVTPGGKVNLLAIASFIMLILAVYTANLAAILTQNAQQTSVDSIDAALRQGYNFCAERKLANAIIDTYGVDPSRIVPDPIDLGGDGKPGFNCPDCDSRERILEYMRRTHNDGSLYCNAAIAKIEDLQIMHRYARHCDKTRVGESLGQRMIGIPIFDGYAAPLSALFHKMKSDGVMNRALVSASPESQCPVPEEEGSALSPQQLTGVWMLTFGFAFIALVIKCVYRRRANMACRGEYERGLRRYDQWLNPPGNEVVVAGYRFDSENNELNELASEQTSFQRSNDLILQESHDSDKFEACCSTSFENSLSSEENGGTGMSLMKGDISGDAAIVQPSKCVIQ
jgi:hypothetical protein